MSTPEELLCSRGWRLRHGLWMLWGILSFGMLWSVAFAIVGFRARNRTWLIFSGIWLAFLVAYIAISSAVDMPGKDEPSTPLSSALGGAIFISWIAGGVLAWFVNRKWLVWLAHNGRRGPWYATATATPGAAAPGGFPAASVSPAAAIDNALRAAPPAHVPATPPAAPAAAPLLTPPAPLAPAAPSRLTPPAPGTLYAPGSAAAPAPAVSTTAASLVDLNTATRDQLASLPGIDLAWADHIIATRQRVGGFTSPADLVTAAGVQPHVFAGVRDRLVATPQAVRPAAPADGRRLEF